MGEVDDAGAWAGWAGSAGLGLALGLGLLYLVLRGTAWSPGRGDPVRAVRTHAMITALIALFGTGAYPITTESEGEAVREIISAPVPGLTWVEGLGIILGPVLGFALVYMVAQYTWPRQSGAVRTARLKDRRPADLMPKWASVTLTLILLFWRSPHVSDLGSHTVPALEGHDAGTSPRAPGPPSPPGTARAVLRLRLDGAVLAWIAAVPTGVVAVAALAFTAVAPADRGGPWALLLWPALPFCAALLILGFTELGVRRGHSPALARLALRRPALGRATAEQDAAIRAGGANRILAVGAAGVLAVTGAALLAGVQVWNGFITSAVLDLGINDLPDGLLMTRGLLLFVLFGLIVACLIAPAPRVPGVATRPDRPGPVHAEQGGSLR